MTNPHTKLAWVAALALAACSGGSASNPDAAVLPPDAPPTDAGPPGDVSTVTARAADAICSALYRCCDDDLVDYFGPFREDDRLIAFRDRLPPTATLDEAGCRAVLHEMLDVVPLGEWVHAAQAGEVTYDDAAFGTCVAALDSASCGPAARAAIWDSTCFAYAPPGGGTEQRRFFHRTRGPGASCAPIRDGIGSVFYGTCDPSVAFCCYSDPTRPGCQFPFAAGGAVRPGTCQAVAGIGQECSPTAPLALCASGNNCDAESATCVAPVTTPLSVGATCVDASYNVLGVCQDSWCDVLGTSRCAAFRDDGAACTGGDECRSGLCRTTCVANDVCSGGPPNTDAGVDAPLPIDAGVDAPMVDAPPVDAPPVDAALDAAPAIDAAPADGERCTSAFDLIGASTASPLAGYTSRIATTFGASNDYNPLSSSGLPPACSVVYDARGKERVYAITLSPGDRLRLRAELTDGRQAALYLLDTCPGGSWPDFDGTGACGSNEYNAGFCGPIGCDHAALDIRYPTMIGGQPAPVATFWVVVDQVGGDASTGFTLDWQRTPL